MNLAEFLPREAVTPDLRADTQVGVLTELVTPLLTLRPELQGIDLIGALCKREKLGSTAVGDGVAIPHGKFAILDKPVMAVGISHDGVNFHAPDHKLSHIFFVLLTPEQGAGQHLRLLAQIARRTKDHVFRSELMLAQTSEQLWQTITAP